MIFVTNIALGYVLVMMLHAGPPTIEDAVILWKREPWVVGLLHQVTGLLHRIHGLRISFPVPRRKISLDTETITPEKIEEKIRTISTLEVKELVDDQSEEIMKITPVQELFDDSLVNVVFKQGGESWLVNDKYVETSIMKLNSVMMESGVFAAQLDQQLRTVRGNAKAEDVAWFLQQLETDCRSYLRSQATITQEIQKQIDQFGELRWVAEEVDVANMEQSSQIETTLNNLAILGVESDPNAVVEQLITELSGLRKARHRLRDIQEGAFLSMVRYENRMDTVNRKQHGFDACVGIENRVSFELNLHQWWEQKRQEKNQLTFALYDIVGFGAINEKIGIKNSDNLLKYLANMIFEKLEGRNYVGLFHGNCLVSVSQNVGLRKTVASVERIRQELNKMRFQNDLNQELIAMKVTCAVTKAQKDTTEEDLMKCLEATLKLAKKAGRNVTFQNDGNMLNPQSVPVEAPDFGLRERIVGISEQKMVPEEPQVVDQYEETLLAEPEPVSV